MKSSFTAAVFLTLAVFTHTASAQVNIHGSLRGRIIDSSNAALAGVTLTLINEATATALKTTSDSSGEYQFARVSPGMYRMTIEKDGFKRAQQERVTISVNEAAVINIALEVGAISETATVQAGSQVVQSQTSNVSQIITGQRIRDLPLNGKNFQRLVSLVPGVGGGYTVNPSVSGARPFTNNYSVDGTTVNDERGTTGMSLGGGGAAEFSGASPNLISTEAIQEFSLITSNADATFGHGSGGQVNAITRSGSNDWHGSAYEYLRNDRLDARDFFNYGPFRDEKGRALAPPFKQNLFGGTFGGRIRRDRDFFFGSYEGFRQRLEQTASAVVPNGDLIRLIPGEAGRLFRLFYIDGGIVPANGAPAGASFSPLSAADRMAALNGGWPAALFNGNHTDGEAGTLLLSTTNTRNVDQNAFLVRTDHRLNDRWQLSFRYGFAQPNAEVNNRAVAGVVQQNLRRWQSGQAQVIYTPSATQIFEGRASLLRSRMRDQPRDPIDPALIAFGVDPQTGLQVQANGSGLRTLQINGATGFLDNQTIPQFSFLHTWTHANLTLRSGVDVKRVNLNVLLISNATFFQFNGIAGPSGLIGASPTQTEAISSQANSTIYGLNGGPTTPARGLRSTEHEYFAQADWRVRRDLTLNLGLRYSYFGPSSEVHNALGNLYAMEGSGKIHVDKPYDFYGPFANVIAGVTDDRPLHQPDKNNFQPRVGVAWNLGGKDRTVLRAGFGVYTDRFFHRLFDFGVLNPPFALSGVYSNIPFPAKAQLPLTADTEPQGRFVNPTLRNPNSYRFNVAVERQLADNTSVTAAYVGMRGRGLFRYEEPNGQAEWLQPLRPDPRFSRYRMVTNRSESKYDALQIFVRHRFSGSLDFTISYTVSRSRDDSSFSFADRPGSTGLQQYPTLINLGASPAAGFQGGGREIAERPIKSDWGYSDFDVPHNLAISHIWELPFGRGKWLFKNSAGWLNALIGGYSLSGIITLRSGEPFTVRAGRDYADIGDQNTLRPALLTGELPDIYSDGSEGKIQYLVSKPRADQLLGTPADVTDPFAPIPRNSLRAPNLRVYDLSLLKRLSLREGVGLAFEVNVFNVFNRANFNEPVFTLTDARFGKVVATKPGTNPRQIQLGLKLSF
jgi:carboxypeptidase family protein